MASSFELTEDRADGALVLRASGKFDRGAGEAVAAHMDAHEGTCVLNMADVEYISSTGVAFLAKLSAGQGLRIADPADCVRNILSLAGVERILSIFASDEEAKQG
ncbi:MAG: STAS domain-containing protein [Planctomycetes bacterium]|nr:STAS domain-containing protein [Planctomycetota bacterium]